MERQLWRISTARPANTTLARELFALQRAAYGVEAQLIGCLEFPPLRESLEELQRSANTFLVLSVDGKIAGALSFSEEGEMVEVTRLIVSPEYFRQGIATRLLSELERRFPMVKCICVTTAGANIPAVRLYRNAGYAISAKSQSPEGIWLVHLRKEKQVS